MLLKYEKEGGVVSHDTYNYVLRTYIAHVTATPAPVEGAEAPSTPAPLSSSFGTIVFDSISLSRSVVGKVQALADQIPRPNVYTFEQVVEVQLAAQDVSGAVASIERAIKAKVPCMLDMLFPLLLTNVIDAEQLYETVMMSIGGLENEASVNAVRTVFTAMAATATSPSTQLFNYAITAVNKPTNVKDVVLVRLVMALNAFILIISATGSRNAVHAGAFGYDHTQSSVVDAFPHPTQPAHAVRRWYIDDGLCLQLSVLGEILDELSVNGSRLFVDGCMVHG